VTRLDTRRARDLLIRRGLTADETARWLLLHDRAAFAERYLSDRAGRPWRPRDYQRASLASYATRKVHCDGRDVGKTTEIEILAAWAAAACPDSEMLIATQCENHLFPLMDRIVRRMESTPALAPSLAESRLRPVGADRRTARHELPGPARGLADRRRGAGDDRDRLGRAVPGAERRRPPLGLRRAERTAQHVLPHDDPAERRAVQLAVVAEPGVHPREGRRARPALRRTRRAGLSPPRARDPRRARSGRLPAGRLPGLRGRRARLPRHCPRRRDAVRAARRRPLRRLLPRLRPRLRAGSLGVRHLPRGRSAAGPRLSRPSARRTLRATGGDHRRARRRLRVPQDRHRQRQQRSRRRARADVTRRRLVRPRPLGRVRRDDRPAAAARRLPRAPAPQGVHDTPHRAPHGRAHRRLPAAGRPRAFLAHYADTTCADEPPARLRPLADAFTF